MNTKFYSLWFDPTKNRTQVNRFSSRRFIHSTTDRLELINCLIGTTRPLFRQRKSFLTFDKSAMMTICTSFTEKVFVMCTISMISSLVRPYEPWTSKYEPRTTV